MLRPLTVDEAARVVVFGTFEIDFVPGPTGDLQQRRAATVFPLGGPKDRGRTLYLREEEERLIREFDYLSHDERGAFGVTVGPGGHLVRDA